MIWETLLQEGNRNVWIQSISVAAAFMTLRFQCRPTTMMHYTLSNRFSFHDLRDHATRRQSKRLNLVNLRPRKIKSLKLPAKGAKLLSILRLCDCKSDLARFRAISMRTRSVPLIFITATNFCGLNLIRRVFERYLTVLILSCLNQLSYGSTEGRVSDWTQFQTAWTLFEWWALMKNWCISSPATCILPDSLVRCL